MAVFNRTYVGVVSEPRRIEVEKGQLKFFAKVVGETDPIYFDEEAARAAGHPGIPAPPTFTHSLAMGAPATRGDILSDIGADIKKLLHGEEHFTHHHPIYAGDVITLITETVDIYDKKNGLLEFLVQDTSAVNQDGTLCVSMRIISVSRNG